MTTPYIILISSSIPTLIFSLIVLIFRNWFINKIQYSIKFQYDKRIEEIKDEYSKRSRAALVAELLSEWIAFSESQKDLNRLTMEAFLWLPEEIAKKLSLRLSNNPKSPDVREIIIDVRRFLLQTTDSIKFTDIIIFEQENKKKKAEIEKNKLDE